MGGVETFGKIEIFMGGGGLEIFRGDEKFLEGGVIKFLEVAVEKIWMGLEFFGRAREKKYSKRQHFKKFFRDQVSNTPPPPPPPKKNPR